MFLSAGRGVMYSYRRATTDVPHASDTLEPEYEALKKAFAEFEKAADAVIQKKGQTAPTTFVLTQFWLKLHVAMREWPKEWKKLVDTKK